MNPKQPSFDARPIGSVPSLAAALGVSPNERGSATAQTGDVNSSTI
jgi:hypothetical protein